MARTETVSPDDTKSLIQFRVGGALLKRIRKAAALRGISRSTWIAEATDAALMNGERHRYMTSAQELMTGRVPVMIRLDAVSLSLIDTAAKEQNSTRTVWIIDACLAALRRV